MSHCFGVLRDLLHKAAGLSVAEDQIDFARHRLAPIAHAAGLDGMAGLVSRMQAGDQALSRVVVEAMTTHETSFFRDRSVFAFFEGTILPNLRQARASTRSLRIWSAACSTGQEPYSIAMLLDERSRDFGGWCVEIDATDLSGQAIAAARAGRYNHFEVQRGTSASRLLRYFARRGDDWEIAEHLRERVRFGAFNLLDDCSRFGPCDVVFCRYVLIYFDRPTVQKLLARLSAVTAPDGYLVVGASETLLGSSDHFRSLPHQPGVLVPRTPD